MPGVSFNLENGNRFLLYVTDEDLRLYDQVERKQIWVKQDSLDNKASLLLRDKTNSISFEWKDMDGTGVHLWIYIGQTLIHKIVANWGKQLSLGRTVKYEGTSELKFSWERFDDNPNNYALFMFVKGSKFRIDVTFIS